MSGGKSRLPPDLVKRAHERLNQWRAAPKRLVACPVCGHDGLKVIDRSARPHSEWYAISCDACGLDDTLHIPTTPPQGY